MKKINILLYTRLLVLSLFLCSSTAAFAQDTDGDTVVDTSDLDDDNDGILDCFENGLTNGTVSSIFELNGSATQSTATQMQLTPDTGSQGGQAWSYGKVDFAKSFTLQYFAYLGTKDADGADGIAAVFQNSPLGINATGLNGSGLGANGIANGLVLELDTFDNGTGVGDVANDHGQIWDSDNQAGAGLLTSPISLPNLENNAFHVVLITWNFATKTLSYTVDGTNAGSYTFPAGNPITNYFGGATKVRFGFTSSTGGFSNTQVIAFDNLCSNLPIELDTDNDGTPNHLDLDSDGDGCFDALEGDEIAIPTQLLANGSVNTAATGGVGAIAANLGVPNLFNSGGAADVGGDVAQGIGDSQNANIKDSVCYTLVLNPDSFNAITGTAFNSTNLLLNDTLNGVQPVIGASPGQVVISQSGNWPTGITLNTTTGTVNVTAAVPAGTYTIQYSVCVNGSNPALCSVQTVTIVVSPDSDLDGVGDNLDLDDDNDGIVDTLETTCTNSATATFNPTTQAWQTTGVNMVAGRTYKIQLSASTLGLVTASGGPNNGLQFYPAGMGAGQVSDYEGNIYNLPTGGSVATFATNSLASQNLAFANLTTADYSNLLTFVGMIDNNTNGQYNPGIDALVRNVFDMSQGPVGGVNFTATTTGTFYIVFTDNPYTDNYGTLSFTVQTCDIDTDGDGIPNRLDLDSDGDGCFDAFEGDENVTASQLNVNGSINTTANGGIGNTAGTNLGVPNLVNSGGTADIGADIGQGIGTSVNSAVNPCTDTDADGITNDTDLDDDNDGISDTAECTLGSATIVTWLNSDNTFAPSVSAGFTGFVTGQNSTAGTGLTRTHSSPQNYQQMVGIDAVTEAAAITNNEYAEYRITTGSRYMAINQIGYYSVPAAVDNTTYSYTLRMSTDNFATNTLVHPAQNFTATGTNVTVNTSATQYLTPNTVYTFRVYFYNVAGGAAASIAHDDFRLIGAFECDTDSDSIPNRLDLDSDGDGCFDAIEGDEGVSNSQLNADGSINVTANGGIGNTAGTNLGVPNLVNSGGAADVGADVGQGIGDTQNALVNGCYCYRQPVTSAGTTVPTKHGITALSRANSGTTDWPVVRQSAWTVLEAKTKGFTVNRVAFSDADANPATPDVPTGIAAANFVEGMMVYDTVANCLKIYNGTAWYCYTTQTCPQ